MFVIRVHSRSPIIILMGKMPKLIIPSFKVFVPPKKKKRKTSTLMMINPYVTYGFFNDLFSSKRGNKTGASIISFQLLTKPLEIFRDNEKIIAKNITDCWKAQLIKTENI